MTRQLQLELLEHYPIKDAVSGLNEPSGLTLDHRGSSLYTVSDGSKLVFNLDFQSRIISDSMFLIEVSDLEGIALTAKTSRCWWFKNRQIQLFASTFSPGKKSNEPPWPA